MEFHEELEKRRQRAALVPQMRRILDAANGRELTNAQRVDFETLRGQYNLITASIGVETVDTADLTTPEQITRAFEAESERRIGPEPSRPYVGEPLVEELAPGEIRVLRNNERLASLVRSAGPSRWGGGGEKLSFDRWLRGRMFGNWENARAELDATRDMGVGSDPLGGYLVPDLLSAQIIDLARNQARVMQAGAVTIPMASGSLAIARVAGDVTAAWKAENAAATSADMTLERVVFTAKTLMAWTKGSLELFEDAQLAADTVESSLAQALALELDRAALRGAGVSEPLGVRNQPNVTIVSMGVNGAALTNYDKFSQAVEDVATNNGTANGVIAHPRTFGVLDRLKDTTNQPLRPPESWGTLGKFPTAQVPVNLVQGTASNASDAYIGDWSQLLVGLRTSVRIEATQVGGGGTAGAFEKLQVWVRAYLRADVQLAHAKHFEAIIGIIP